MRLDHERRPLLDGRVIISPGAGAFVAIANGTRRGSKRRNTFAASLVAFLLVASSPLPVLYAAEPDEGTDAASFADTYDLSIEEAHERLTRREGLDAAITYLTSRRELVGGVSMDQEAGGILDIALTGDAPEIRAAAAPLLPPGSVVRWRTVERSLAELDAIRDRLIDRVADFKRAGAPVAHIAIDVHENQVVLTLDGPISTIRSRLGEEFGPALEVRSGPMLTSVTCSTRSVCTPWRGGIRINPLDGTGFICTYGFNVRSTISATKYMMTAGHCDNETWRHNFVTIGTTNLNNLQTSGSVYGDFQRAPASLSSPMNLIYAADSDKSRAITAYRAYTSQHVGDYVCASGIVNSYRCGSIVNADFYYGIVFRGQTIYMWGKLAGSTADPLRSDDGDSGGPVFINATALGIVSAKDGTTKTAYGVADMAMEALGIRFCLSSLCP